MDKQLAAGFDVNANPCGFGGRTALQAAAGGGHLKIVDKLLAAGSNANAAPGGRNARTALQAATEGRRLEIVELQDPSSMLRLVISKAGRR